MKLDMQAKLENQADDSKYKWGNKWPRPLGRKQHSNKNTPYRVDCGEGYFLVL